MKILITTDWYAPIVNGVVTSVLNLKRELEESGHDVRVLTLASEKYSYKENNIYYLKSYDFGKIYPNARATICHREELVEELIQWSPDVIHSQCEFMTFPYAVKISKKCHCPVVHTYHTVYEDYTHYFSPSKTVGRKVVAVWSRKLLDKVDAVIVPTAKVRNLLYEYQVEQQIEVIPTGIDLRKYSARITEDERARRKELLGIPKENKVLVNVGRLAKEKNLAEILEYMKKMDRKDLTLLLVGDGPYREELEKKTKEMELEGQVVFAGMIDPSEVGSYYQLGDVFVSASNSETQGLTYLEALASGIPALCRKDECLDGVITDGYNGFQYDSYEYFKMHLEYMLADEERRLVMAEQAMDDAVRFSTWEFGNRAEQLYRQVIGVQAAKDYTGYLLGWIHNMVIRRNS